MKHVTNLFLLFCSNFLYSAEQKIIFDSDRQRSIPIEIYQPSKITRRPVIIINHGYGVKNTEYTFLAKPLCQEGYVVISIQHDLPTDPPLPRTGNLIERRKPMWESGVQNILIVLSTINYEKVILIGHSNGGDISMLFTTLHPEIVVKVISLDSLRMPFPTKDQIPILSLRAHDTMADAGVIPESGALIINLENANHIDMYDQGPEEIKREILSIIDRFLKERL